MGGTTLHADILVQWSELLLLVFLFGIMQPMRANRETGNLRKG